MAWLVLADQQRALGLADRGAVAVAAMTNGAKVEWPSPAEYVAGLWEALCAPPASSTLTPELRDVYSVLGLDL